MKEVETKYVDKNPDIKKEIIKETETVKQEIKEEINYDFVVKILKKNIGIEIDDFFRINIGQKITKYNTESFSRYAILSLEKSKNEIIKEFKKILNKK